MIIGGACQGKLAYALQAYNISENEIADGHDFFEKNSEVKCINNFHLLIKDFRENGLNPLEETAEILNNNPDIIILMNEIGNGIIPIEKSERLWREDVGRVGCLIAQRAESVERIICGIPTKIKG